MTYTIRHSFADHKDGTKRYETYEITGGKRGVLITNWGPYKPGESIGIRSEKKCQVFDLRPNEVQWEGDRIRKGKKGRGYTFRDFMAGVNVFDSVEKLRMWMDVEFEPAVVAKAINILVSGSASMSSPDFADAPNEVEEDIGIVEEPVKATEPNEAWGSW